MFLGRGGGEESFLKRHRYTVYPCMYCVCNYGQTLRCNFITRKKYKKKYVSYVRNTILFIRGHSMECRSHANEFRVLVYAFQTQKFYVSFHGKLKLSLPIL